MIKLMDIIPAQLYEHLEPQFALQNRFEWRQYRRTFAILQQKKKECKQPATKESFTGIAQKKWNRKQFQSQICCW